MQFVCYLLPLSPIRLNAIYTIHKTCLLYIVSVINRILLYTYHKYTQNSLLSSPHQYLVSPPPYLSVIADYGFLYSTYSSTWPTGLWGKVGQLACVGSFTSSHYLNTTRLWSFSVCWIRVLATHVNIHMHSC